MTSTSNAGYTWGLSYDAENRMTYADSAGVQLMYYGYDAQNKRIWSWTGAADTYGNPTGYLVNVYSASGQKLGAYQFSTYYLGYIASTLMTSDQYFGSRRLAVMDQLGSVVKNTPSQAQAYYPWGETKGNTNPQDTWNFATYWQDSTTGLDYANNRYYSNAYGRFMTPDPYTNSGRLTDPQSWNRYAYTRGDPVNRYDPAGMDDSTPTFTDTVWGWGDPFDGFWESMSGANFGAGCAAGYTEACSFAQNGITVSAQGGQGGASGTVQAGMQVATQALQAVATTVFSAQCENFIDNALGSGALEVAQLDAAQTTVQNAAGITTAAGATLFPNNPTLAAQQQATANQLTGISGASLSQLAAVSPTTYAWGQYTGNTVFINNATSWAGWGSGWALYTMLHEMLHVAGLGGDTQIEAAFGILPATVAAVGSTSITIKLASECGQ